jgi:hypothetical protein
MCGLLCAGKTTLARQIERERAALRLTPDEWIARLIGQDASVEALDAARDPFEALLWELAERVLTLGVDVILDFGFWSRSEREDFRSRAGQLGARSELHFLDVPEEELLARLAARNANLPPGTFRIDEARLRLWHSQFEPPTPDELLPREVGFPAGRPVNDLNILAADRCGCRVEVPDRLETLEELGMDRHYAEITLLRCRDCGQFWLRYFYENEAFTRSGRWYLGAITPEQRAALSPERAKAMLESLDWYYYGGSFYDGRRGRASGEIML